jgi:hypothetical protein
MKFLIQKINGEIRHDFSFTLLESIRFKNWLTRNDKKDKIIVKYINIPELLEPDDIYPPILFKSFHSSYVPVGSVEFVTEFLQKFYGLTPKPRNVPEALFDVRYAQRYIINSTEAYFPHCGKSFIKSNDKIKSVCGIFNEKEPINLPAGNYQFSEVISINSEWRAFVYEGKLIGLQNYSGEFTVFPDVEAIRSMINAFEKSGTAPVAYTLDVGVNNYHTFIIEIHDFFSCGLYGFTEHAKYPSMLHKWFYQYIQREMVLNKK